MRLPPFLLRLGFHGPRHSFGLWLPLFILGPIFALFVLALFLIALPFALVSLLFTWQWRWWRIYLLSLPAIFRLTWALRGLRVDVEDRLQHVVIAFY
jgi:pilus assembly protein TadC